MIPLSIAEIAAVVGGTIEGDATVTVTAPAVLDGLQAEPGGLFAPSPASTPTAALQALAAHVVARLRDGLTVAGLTGSRGKTSTKDLLAAVLRAGTVGDSRA